MKKIILLILLLFCKVTYAQEIMSTSAGIINFEASVPLFEEVKAKNETAQCILIIKTGEISSILLIKDFHFKLSLMEKHFNEKYIESDRYPKASFKGVIQGFNLNIIGSAPKEFNLKGKLEIHGKSKKINTVINIKKIETGLEIITDFNVNSRDFNILIPEILSMKVAETVNIKSNFLLK